MTKRLPPPNERLTFFGRETQVMLAVRRFQLWRIITHRLHGWVNRLAWRYARPEGPEFGIATRIDKTRLLWRLNDWLASQWLPEWVRKGGTIRG